MRETYRALSDLLRLLQFRDRDRICCHGVSVSQCHALDVLVREGALRLNELAVRLYLGKSTTSRVVDALLRKGYVERRTDPDDSRAVRLEATPAGRELHDRIEEDLLAETRGLLRGFGPEGRRAARELLERMRRRAIDRIEVEGGCCRLRPPA